MTLPTRPYKGTRDFYPEAMAFRRWMFGTLEKTVCRFGFEEYDGPILESFDLYAAKTGEEIVKNQLYWMEDRGGRKLAIRPEMTPTMARMVAAKIQELPRPIRWYSIPNLWRYERPQRGRLREHWQLNADILDGDVQFADLEILQLAFSVMEAFGGGEFIEIRINHRAMVDEYFEKVIGVTTEVAHGLIKLIDLKDKMEAESFNEKLSALGLTESQAQSVIQFFELEYNEISEKISGSGKLEMDRLFENLKGSQLEHAVVYDPSILRGMDYYTGLVFEIYDKSPENRRALFGGGRYDNLLGLFGKTQLSGIGFGMGDVGLENFLLTHDLIPLVRNRKDVYVSMTDERYEKLCIQVTEDLRAKGLSVVTPLSVGKLKIQLKQANQHDAHFLVILGEEEFENNCASVKNLDTGDQFQCSIGEIFNRINTDLN